MFKSYSDGKLRLYIDLLTCLVLEYKDAGKGENTVKALEKVLNDLTGEYKTRPSYCSRESVTIDEPVFVTIPRQNSKPRLSVSSLKKIPKKFSKSVDKHKKS